MVADEAEADRRAATFAGHWLDGERIRVYPWLLLVFFAVGAAVWTALSLPDLVDPRGKPLGYDFIAFWSAARLAVMGRPEAAFDWAALAATHQTAVPGLHGIVFAWHYPPTFLLLLLPLGLLPYLPAFLAFMAASVVLWAALVRRLFADPRAWVIAAAFPGGLVNLMYGQNGFLTAALAGFALLALDRRPFVAGGLIGLLAIKPHLALLFPLALAAERRWRAFAAAAATSLAFAIASVAVFGWPTVMAFLRDLPSVRRLVDSGELSWAKMPSAYVFALSAGMPTAAATALQLASAGAAAIGVWVAWRSPNAPFEAKAAVLALASLLVPPYVFSYDLIWAGLALAWLTILALRHGFRLYEREMLLAGWASPLLIQPVYAMTRVEVGFLILLMLLALALLRALSPPEGDIGRAQPGIPG